MRRRNRWLGVSAILLPALAAGAALDGVGRLWLARIGFVTDPLRQ